MSSFKIATMATALLLCTCTCASAAAKGGGGGGHGGGGHSGAGCGGSIGISAADYRSVNGAGSNGLNTGSQSNSVTNAFASQWAATNPTAGTTRSGSVTGGYTSSSPGQGNASLAGMQSPLDPAALRELSIQYEFAEENMKAGMATSADYDLVERFYAAQTLH